MLYERRPSPRFVGLLSSSLCAALWLAATAAHAQLTAGAPADNFTQTNWVTGLSNPTDVAFLVDGRAVITQKGGTITVRRANGTLNSNAGSITVQQGNNEQGLLGVVALLNFREKATGTDRDRTVFFYASIVGDNNSKHKVFRGLVNANDSVTVDTANPVVSMGLAGPANHNGGGLVIYRDQIYISVGDTGANATPPQNKFSSCLNRANGKILRVNIDGSIPTDNPLVNVAQVTSCTSTTGAFGMAAPDTRIYAWGLRNPWRFWIDPMSGLMWIGDVGEGTREEVSVGSNGTHFGYPYEEGTTKYSQGFTPGTCTAMTPAKPCTPPVSDYPHQSGDNCVVGGPIANEDGRLCGWPDAFKNKYFFGDHGSGRVWTLDVNANRMGVVAAARTNFGTISGLASLRMGIDDALYAAAHDAGSIVKIAPKNRDAAACAAMAMNMGGSGGNPGTGGSAGGGAGGSAGGGGSASGGAGGSAGNGGSAGGGGNAGRGGSAGSGGNPGAGGSAGSGGSVGSGGRGGNGGAGTGGAAGNAGNTSQGGSPAGGGAQGGSPGQGGSDNQAGDSAQGGESGAAGSDSGNLMTGAGCGCRFGHTSDAGGTALMFLMAGAWWLRRRRR